MPSALKSKICWNCDGTLGLEEHQCPLCGTSQDALDLVEPGDRVVPIPVDPLQEALKKVSIVEKSEKMVLDRLTEKELLLLTLVSTMLGASLLLFTLMLFLFSKGGVLRISWDASLWPFFGILSSALLYISYKAQSKI